MADYTYQELMKMQNDAIRRAADMQQRAQKTAGLNQPEEEKEKTPVSQPKHIPMPGGYLETGDKNKANKNPPKQTGGDSFFEKLKNGFGDIDIDSDKALLLSLIMLLSQEQADELLIMALIYMLT